MTFKTPEEFSALLSQAWSLESSASYTPQNPAKGQCSVSSLVAQDIFGGDILTTKTRGGTHFYNRIEGKRYDFTISQFDDEISFDDRPSNREEAFGDTSDVQYKALRRRLNLSAE